MTQIKKICAYMFCSKPEFITSNPKKNYCSPTHRVRASELRNGKAPDHLLGDDFEVIKKEIKVTNPNPKYIKLQNEVTELQKHKDDLLKQKDELLLKISNLEIDSNMYLGAFGGGLTALILTEPKVKLKSPKVIDTSVNQNPEEKPEDQKNENNLLRTAVVVGATIAGGILFKRTKDVTAQNNDLIIKYRGLIADIDLGIREIEVELFSKRLSLSLTPNELEEIQVKEFKVPNGRK